MAKRNLHAKFAISSLFNSRELQVGMFNTSELNRFSQAIGVIAKI